jgi:hypothetical protein
MWHVHLQTSPISLPPHRATQNCVKLVETDLKKFFTSPLYGGVARFFWSKHTKAGKYTK